MHIQYFKGEFKYYVYIKTLGLSDSFLERGLHVLMHCGLLCLTLPEQQCFPISQSENDMLLELSDGDALVNLSDGNLRVLFQSTSSDNAIIVTEKCNSNCIMCPVPESMRRYTDDIDVQDLIEQTRYISVDVDHITITGGEPFIAGKKLFKILKELKEFHNEIDYLLLTNGRAFADTAYAREFEVAQPSRMIVGIPIHGADAKTHDWITQSPGSFEQTILGIRHLLCLGCSVEIRFVISKLNMNSITQMARLVASELKGIVGVKFMGLEMTGNAACNTDQVWLPYQDAFEASRLGIDLLLMQGVDVELYNFPLCMVDKRYWFLCRKSITGFKVRYYDDCTACCVKDACGGIFLGTKRLVNKVMPIMENRCV